MAPQRQSHHRVRCLHHRRREDVRSAKPKHRQQKQLSLDLESAFNSKDFADVQVECEGRVFDCHQVVLSSRSPVFKAMLLADMAEAKAKKVCCFTYNYLYNPACFR